ncbi:cystatin-B-like [Stegostoma tigrinum]|uniref:cystatin-B-like n=1 Tax=Stegostoma tigrinum TaxID=3053191 RepID=UPI0028709EFE|nr:cystatin-B-like [Stegostoma tigrinum]XP_059500266.1 cystatin-B-like [Stegostoma tigrinum]
MEQGQCIVGGYDAVQAVTEEVQDLAQKVKLQVEKKVCRKFETYHAISYCSQVVAGTNLSIKIVVGPGDDYIHVDVYKPLPSSGEPVKVTNVLTGKKLFDDIQGQPPFPHVPQRLSS